jgi:hypothetical protein
MPDVVDGGPQDDMVTDMDRVAEDEGVDLGRDNLAAAMALAGHGRHHVDPTDDGATKSGPLRVRLLGHHKVPRFYRTLTRCFALIACHADHSATILGDKSTRR